MTYRRIRRLFSLAIAGLMLSAGSKAAGPYQFYSVNPCRVLDTRAVNGPTGGQPLTGGALYAFSITGHCSIPPNAASAVLNITVVGPATFGFLIAWQYGQPTP